MFPGLDLYCADTAQPFITAREELDGLDHDLSDLFVMRRACRRYSCMVMVTYVVDTFPPLYTIESSY